MNEMQFTLSVSFDDIVNGGWVTYKINLHNVTNQYSSSVEKCVSKRLKNRCHIFTQNFKTLKI
jgi:hypothetical protein